MTYARATLAPATLPAYQAGWRAFSEWCQLAGQPARQSAALATPKIRWLVATCHTWTLADPRDRTLLLLGYAAALRRAELVAVEREHVSFTPEGLRSQIL